MNEDNCKVKNFEMSAILLMWFIYKSMLGRKCSTQVQTRYIHNLRDLCVLVYALFL